MLPPALDEAVSDLLINFGKCRSLPLPAGLPLGLSWRLAARPRVYLGEFHSQDRRRRRPLSHGESRDVRVEVCFQGLRRHQLIDLINRLSEELDAHVHGLAKSDAAPSDCTRFSANGSPCRVKKVNRSRK
jgi:hypothetical protein